MYPMSLALPDAGLMIASNICLAGGAISKGSKAYNGFLSKDIDFLLKAPHGVVSSVPASPHGKNAGGRRTVLAAPSRPLKQAVQRSLKAISN